MTPRKEATAFDYTPDGSGRDSYVIRAFGLKRDYKDNYQNFQRGLRSGNETPVMDLRIRRMSHPLENDIPMYSNWPSF